MRILMIIMGACLITNGVQAKDPYVLHPTTDILHYEFHIELDTTTSEINAQARITFRYDKRENHLFLDLINKQDSLGMIVSKVLTGSTSLPFRHENNQLIIDCPALSAPDSLFSLTVHYHGIPADGLIISKNKFGRPSFFGDNWPDRARNWLPVVDHPSDKATVDFFVKAPADLEVVATGQFVSEVPAGRNMSQTHYRSSVPLPTKVMVIGVSQFARQLAGVTDGIPVETWVYEENYVEGFTDYKPAVDIVRFYNNKIGAFAFEKLANVQSKTVYGGMENSGTIFYNENSVSGNNQMQRLMAHEIAHQWFGDAVTEKDWYHIWLSEGFATYLEAVCMDELFGAYKLPDHMKQLRKRVLSYYNRRQSPVVDTTVTQMIRLLNTNSYQKGAWVLHMLRNKIGEEAFWQGLHTYYNQFKNSNALTEDFRKTMEAVSGQNLQYFFKQWLYTAGHPVLDISYSNSGHPEKTTITVRQLQSQRFLFPLTVRLESAAGDQTQSFTTTLDIKSREQSFDLSPGFITDSLQVDPDVQLLFDRSSLEN